MLDQVNLGKVEITINKANEEISNLLEKKFGNKVKLTINENLKRPKVEISRFRDWTVLGGGIAGTRSSGNKDCTVAAVGYKNGQYFLITAGHCVTNIGQNYYQYSNKVGIQHASAATYNSSDIGLIRIEDSAFPSTGIQRRASNKLYLEDENNSNYSGRITSTDAWPLLGDIVKKSGGTTGVTAGRIESAYVQVNYKNYPTVYCAKVNPIGVSRYSDGGDSGAPTYKSVDGINKILVGVHSGGDGVNGYFAPAHQIYSSFGNDFSVYTNNYEVPLN